MFGNQFTRYITVKNCVCASVEGGGGEKCSVNEMIVSKNDSDLQYGD